MTPPSDCVELLRAMVRFDSVTPTISGRREAEAELGAWLAGLCEEWGFDVSLLPVAGAAPNVLAACRISADAPWILLDSHLDTVGVDGMTIEPFAAELRNGRIWGRGAADTKGTGAAMLWAMKESAQEGSLGWNTALLFSVGEEHQQVGARSFVERDLPNLGWRPRLAVVGEPTGMRVVAAANGYVRAEVSTIGESAHSSSPERGRNAIVDMARVVLGINKELGAGVPGSFSINDIAGGGQINVVPDRCAIRIDRRFPPGVSSNDALAGIDRALERVRRDDPDLKVAFEGAESADPFDCRGAGGVASWTVDALRLVGLNASVEAAPYTTNANRLAASGLPCVVVGPGDIAQAHTADESIGVDEIAEGVRGYRAILETGP